jgi:hypothetical protein
MTDAIAVAAYAAAIIHFAFVAQVLLGGLLPLLSPRLTPLHAPFLIYAIIIEAIRFPCPLTQIEKNLRFLANLPNYTGGFLGHYVEPYIAATGLPPVVYQNMGYCTVGLNIVLYGYLFWRWRKGKGGEGERLGSRDVA